MNETTKALDDEIKQLKDDNFRKDKYVVNLISEVNKLRKENEIFSNTINEILNCDTLEEGKATRCYELICKIQKEYVKGFHINV